VGGGHKNSQKHQRVNYKGHSGVGPGSGMGVKKAK